MNFTYDLNTPIGLTRLNIADTNVETPLFDDAEIAVKLGQWGMNTYLAGADLLDIAATDAARIAIITKNEQQNTDPSKVSALLSERADKLRTLGAVSVTTAFVNDPNGIYPDRIFSTDANGGNIEGTMSGW